MSCIFISQWVSYFHWSMNYGNHYFICLWFYECHNLMRQWFYEPHNFISHWIMSHMNSLTHEMMSSIIRWLMQISGPLLFISQWIIELIISLVKWKCPLLTNDFITQWLWKPIAFALCSRIFSWLLTLILASYLRLAYVN